MVYIQSELNYTVDPNSAWVQSTTCRLIPQLIRPLSFAYWLSGLFARFAKTSRAATSTDQTVEPMLQAMGSSIWSRHCLSETGLQHAVHLSELRNFSMVRHPLSLRSQRWLAPLKSRVISSSQTVWRWL